MKQWADPLKNLRTSHEHFCRRKYAADLPGDQNDPRQNHQEGHPFSAFGKGGDVAETNRGQGHHGEIESIGEGGDAGIDGMLDPIKKDR